MNDRIHTISIDIDLDTDTVAAKMAAAAISDQAGEYFERAMELRMGGETRRANNLDQLAASMAAIAKQLDAAV